MAAMWEEIPTDDDELFARIPFYWNSPNKCKSIA
jgi:hypothetical protein